MILSRCDGRERQRRANHRRKEYTRFHRLLGQSPSSREVSSLRARAT
ncbi:hypothetical protein A7982_12450 [Minicystis rosea]|nr:hypothetical protein A7982_12450 [Minicystis rosea]